MNYQWDSPGKVSATEPTGLLLSVEDLAFYLDGFDESDPKLAALLGRIASTASNLVEQWLGTAFRSRTVTVEATVGGSLTLYGGDTRIQPVRLPWGAPSAISAERIDSEPAEPVPESDYELETMYERIVFVRFKGSGTYRIVYDVGYDSVPDDVGLAVSRVASALYYERMPDAQTVPTRNVLKRDVLSLLEEHRFAAPDY